MTMSATHNTNKMCKHFDYKNTVQENFVITRVYTSGHNSDQPAYILT